MYCLQLGSPSGPSPILVSRLPTRHSTKEGVRRGTARNSEQTASKMGAVVEKHAIEEVIKLLWVS